MGEPHFFPNLKRAGHIFSRFSKACDISIKRAYSGTRYKLFKSFIFE